AKSSTAFGSLLGLSLLVCLHSDGDQFSSTPRDDFWMPGAGGVGKVLEASGVVYVGGGFRVLIPSPPSGAGAYDVNSGARDQDFPKVNGSVWVVIPDSEGGWFIGGDFTSVGDTAVRNLAHVRDDKSVDPNWVPNPDGDVRALAISDNVLYVGGNFASIGSQPRSSIAAIDSPTGKGM